MFQFVTRGEGGVLTTETSYEQTLKRSTSRCYTPNIKALSLPLSEKKKLKFSFFVPMFKLVTPPGQGQFGPHAQHVNKLGKGSLGDVT